MIFRTLVQDCLRINWAVPRGLLAEPPKGLRYDVLNDGSAERVMVSALLYRQESPLPTASLPRMNYPQLKVQCCMHDQKGRPTLWVNAVYLPTWLLPSMRIIAGRLARSARLDYPHLGQPGIEGERWTWTAHKADKLGVTVVVSQPRAVPLVGSWTELLRYFDRRDETSIVRGRTRQAQIDYTPSTPLPVEVEVAEASLVSRQLIGGQELPPVHSAWLTPSLNASFEYLAEAEPTVGPHLPAVG